MLIKILVNVTRKPKQLVWLLTSVVAWVRANVFGTSKRWIPVNYYITLSFQGNQFCLVFEYEFTSEGLTLKRLSDLLFVIIPSYYALYPDLPDKLSVKARPNQMQMWEMQIKQLLLPLYKSLLSRSVNGSTDDCVNPLRHDSSSTISVHVMLISVSIKMCPFWFVILRP